VDFNIRHNQKSCPGNTTECDTPFSIKTIAQDWDSADFVALVNPFIEDVLGSDFQLMEPDPALVSGGRGGKYALADPDREKILILTMGVNDSWDSGDGGSISIDLGGSSGHWDASWFDPRSGERTCHGSLHLIRMPGSCCWIRSAAASRRSVRETANPGPPVIID
jgi:hypothetical protein